MLQQRRSVDSWGSPRCPTARQERHSGISRPIIPIPLIGSANFIASFDRSGRIRSYFSGGWL
jgi:hypothetical protein